MASSYKAYLRIASNRILLTREKCPHKSQDWKEKDTLYWRCGHCGAFVAFRNPEDVKRRGEFGKGAEQFVQETTVVHLCTPVVPELVP